MPGRHKQTKKVDRTIVEKAIKDTRKRIRKLDLELRRILDTMNSAPLCQHIFFPPLSKTKKSRHRR